MRSTLAILKPLTLFMLVVGLLVACQQPETTITPPPTALEVPVEKDSVLPVVPATEDELPDGQVELPDEQIEVSGESFESIPPLDLTLPDEIFVDNSKSTLQLEEESRLLDLFSTPKKPTMTVSGKLLFEQDKRAALDSVDGAQIDVIIPID